MYRRRERKNKRVLVKTTDIYSWLYIRCISSSLSLSPFEEEAEYKMEEDQSLAIAVAAEKAGVTRTALPVEKINWINNIDRFINQPTDGFVVKTIPIEIFSLLWIA